ncbi:UpxY family transcription antiterminator [Candidatus Bathyarchaeota archaeon]|nr:UpxY family transcription antiterminator [Candidatus Bathyarchaeota archaeon]
MNNLLQKSINNNSSHLNEIKNWYVLYTRPNTEKRVGLDLQKIGFESYVPLQKELRHWKDRKRWVKTPLFKSYVFIKIDNKERGRAFKVNGILRYVSFNGQPAKLREEEIKKIRLLCKNESRITIDFNDLEVGKNVLICEGPLMSLRGKLVHIKSSSKIKIYIEGLSCFASILLDTEKVKIQLL